MRQRPEDPDTLPGGPWALFERARDLTDLTSLLSELRHGDRDALDRAVSCLYAELRQAAARQLKRERPGHTLYPTALVHEAYLKLADAPGVKVADRGHFVAVAARAMRQILVDHARRRDAGKRGGHLVRTTLDGKEPGGEDLQVEDVLAIDAALERLGALDERARTIVECRFYVGLTEEETADLLHLSSRTVRREWLKARAWLHAELARERPDRGT